MFIDESGFHISMTRLRARAPRGERGYGKVSRNRGKNHTLITSIYLQGAMDEANSIKGSTDAELFETYVEEFLAPTLEAGQVMVLNVLGAHRTNKVRELIEGRGAELVLLPSCSADLNPIEEAFPKINNIVRTFGARTREALDEAISEALHRSCSKTWRDGFHTAATNHGINTHEDRDQSHKWLSFDNLGTIHVLHNSLQGREGTQDDAKSFT